MGSLTLSERSESKGGRGAFLHRRSWIARSGGGVRSENVGISSKNEGENPSHRKPKVSWATKIDPGLVGPKARPKGVVDGQLVNIPAPSYILFTLTHQTNLNVFLTTCVAGPFRGIGSRQSRKA